MGAITLADLNNEFPLDAIAKSAEAQAAESLKENPIRFLHHYASWNGYFGSGVASLAGKVGRSRDVFMADGPFACLADRSVVIASYFFDAARDEFNDSGTDHRDTHRCLAQAMMKGTLGYFDLLGPMAWDDERTEELIFPPVWLRALEDRVSIGYGAGSPDCTTSLFRAMGYHLGSEIVADKEFTAIDNAIMRIHPDLKDHLKKTEVQIGDNSHNCYYWIEIHAGTGGAVEMEHFEYAMKGVRLALKYVSPILKDDMRHQAMLGFEDFVRDHEEFFSNI